MANNIYTADTQLLKQPDVFDVLQPVDLAETPLFNMLPKGPNPENDEFQYPFDVPDVATNTGSAEGNVWDKTSTRTYGSRDMIKTRIHHIENSFGVGVVANANAVWGTDGMSEFERAQYLALRQLVTSIEYIIVGDQENQAGSKTDSYITRGLEVWLTHALQTDTDTITPSAFRPSNPGQIATLTLSGGGYTLAESDITGVLGSIFDTQRAFPKRDVFCRRRFRDKVDGFGNLVPVASGFNAVRRFDQGMDGKIDSAIKVLSTSNGECTFHPSHVFMGYNATQRAEAFFLETAHYVKLRVRKAPYSVPVAPQGTTKPGMVAATFGLQVIPTYLGMIRAA